MLMPVQVSEFAKKNSIKDQRKLLPVYECREDLLQVIRENQVVVVVGETGSGKTTQASRHQRSPQITALDCESDSSLSTREVNPVRSHSCPDRCAYTVMDTLHGCQILSYTL